MADLELFKNKIPSMLSQDYTIEFLGNDFGIIVGMLSAKQEGKVCKWVNEVMDKRIKPITIGQKRPYKRWMVNGLLVFRYAFALNNSQYRILLVKVKNSIYIEFHLGSHK